LSATQFERRIGHWLKNNRHTATPKAQLRLRQCISFFRRAPSRQDLSPSGQHPDE
jgi:hypothetical protein